MEVEGGQGLAGVGELTVGTDRRRRIRGEWKFHFLAREGRK